MREISSDILKLAARCMRTHRHQFTYAGKLYIVQPRSHNAFTLRESHSGNAMHYRINNAGNAYQITKEELINGALQNHYGRGW